MLFWEEIGKLQTQKVRPIFSSQPSCWIELKISRKDLPMCLDDILRRDRQIANTKISTHFFKPAKTQKISKFSSCWNELKIGRKVLPMCLDAILRQDSQIAITKFRPIFSSPTKLKKSQNFQVVELSWKLAGKTFLCF